MRKRILVLLVLIMSFMLIIPIEADALPSREINNNELSENVFMLTKIDNMKKKKKKTEPITDIDDVDDLLDDYDQEQDCNGSNSIFGDPEDEDSVAWLLQQTLNYIKVIGPILVVILSSIDFVYVIVKSDDEAMKKATKKLTYRIILALLLFFIPTLVQVALDLFGMATDPTCGLH